MKIYDESQGADGDNYVHFYGDRADNRPVLKYQPRNVTTSATMHLALLKSAERELEAFEARYRSMSEVCELAKEARLRVIARRVEHEQRL